jgi:hypothetical protein
MNLQPPPCATGELDGKYRLCMSFVGHEAIVGQSDIMDAARVSEVHSELIEALLSTYPDARAEDCGLTMKVHGVGVEPYMTALVWVSEVTE